MAHTTYILLELSNHYYLLKEILEEPERQKRLKNYISKKMPGLKNGYKQLSIIINKSKLIQNIFLTIESQLSIWKWYKNLNK